MPRTDPGLDPATHRTIAVALFNRVWQLMDADARSAEQDDELIHAAHASAYHWMQVGTPVNRARSEWQCSRVYAVLGHAEPALRHARRCLNICNSEGIGDFDLAYAYEAMARACAIAGDSAAVDEWMQRARDAAADIAKDGDRKLLLSDLATVPGSV